MCDKNQEKNKEKNNKIMKIDEIYYNAIYKIGQKWWIFKGVTPLTPIFLKSAPPKN